MKISVVSLVTYICECVYSEYIHIYIYFENFYFYYPTTPLALFQYASITVNDELLIPNGRISRVSNMACELSKEMSFQYKLGF